jgi:hypothetical protein
MHVQFKTVSSTTKRNLFTQSQDASALQNFKTAGLLYLLVRPASGKQSSNSFRIGLTPDQQG